MQYKPELITAARKAAGLTQPEVARRIGKATSTYVRYEAGVIIPSVHVLGEIAAALGEPIGSFYDPNDPADAVTAFAEQVKAIVDGWPPFTEEQKARLRVLLRGVA